MTVHGSWRVDCLTRHDGWTALPATHCSAAAWLWCRRGAPLLQVARVLHADSRPLLCTGVSSCQEAPPSDPPTLPPAQSPTGSTTTYSCCTACLLPSALLLHWHVPLGASAPPVCCPWRNCTACLLPLAQSHRVPHAPHSAPMPGGAPQGRDHPARGHGWRCRV